MRPAGLPIDPLNAAAAIVLAVAAIAYPIIGLGLSVLALVWIGRRLADDEGNV
ncbi:MAG: hypothetical protein NVS4B13_01040 [Candidatus Elarobacter sp.]